MSNSPGNNPGNNATSADIDALVGQAWSQHYHGKDAEALPQFQQLVQRWPDHIDANYGLALTLKVLGQKQEAATAFQKTLSLVNAILANPSDDNSRFHMLKRMIEQQLASI
jgi:Flp pilus assembly protein TadD